MPRPALHLTVGPDIGPLLEHGAVEPLDLAIGLWPVGLVLGV